MINIRAQDNIFTAFSHKSRQIQLLKIEHLKSEKTILEEISLDPHPFIVNLAGSFQDKRYMYMGTWHRIIDHQFGAAIFLLRLL